MDLSIIIPSYNTAKETCECIASIYKSLESLKVIKSKNYEIIVFDNNSNDDTVSRIKRQFPHVILLQNKENLGYGKGNNAAVKKARGETILFLNSDIVVLKNAIETLYSFFIQYEQTYQLLGARLRNRDMTLQPSAAPFFSLAVVFAALFLKGDYWGLTRYSPPVPKQVDWVSGACFMIRKKSFERLGGFDEHIFMYMEEVDFMYRARKQGLLVGFCPAAEFIHYGAFSSNKGEIKIKPIVNLFKGFLYFYQKHKSKEELNMLKLLLLAKARIGMIAGRLFHNAYLKQTYEEAYRLVQKS